MFKNSGDSFTTVPAVLSIYGHYCLFVFSRLVVSSIQQIPFDRPRSQRIFVFQKVRKPLMPPFLTVGFLSRSFSFFITYHLFLAFHKGTALVRHHCRTIPLRCPRASLIFSQRKPLTRKQNLLQSLNAEMFYRQVALGFIETVPFHLVVRLADRQPAKFQLQFRIRTEQAIHNSEDFFSRQTVHSDFSKSINTSAEALSHLFFRC